MKWYSSIKVQMSILIVFLITTILAVFGVINYFKTRNMMMSDLEHFADIATNRLSKHLALPLWSMNIQQTSDSVVAEMMEDRIQAIIVKEGDKHSILLGKMRNKKGDVVDAIEEPEGNFIKREANLTLNSNMLGSVEVYITPRIMEEQIKRSAISIVMQVLVLDAVIFLTIFLVISNRIIRNIKKLTDAAEKMSMGDLKAVIDIHSTNEIGLLAQAIERMQDSLGIAMKRMKAKAK